MRLLSLQVPVGLGCVAVLAAAVSAQQVTVSTPFHSASDSFFENMGSGWGLSGPNWFFSTGGSPVQAAPQFGGFDPSAGANLGFGWRAGGINGFFGGNWSQGYRQSFTSQVPSITLTNGVPGIIADTSISPFVMGFVPIVGGYPSAWFSPAAPPGMLPSAGASGVGRDAVVAALQRARQEQQQREAFEEAAAGQIERAAHPAVPDVPRQPAQDAQNEHAPQNRPDDLVLVGAGAPAVQTSKAAADGPTAKLAAAKASSAGRPAPSIEEARRMRAAEQAEQQAKALKYVELARNAEALGKPNVARIYYQNAARYAAGELRGQILARLAALERGASAR